MRKRFTTTIFLILPLFLFAQRPLVEGWNENKVKSSSSTYAPCMIRLPDGYFLASNAARRYPVIFSFHGTREAGTDTVSILNTGLCRNLSNHGATSYTDESGTKALGSDVPAAVDKNGNMREAIVIAPQRSSYSIDPSWYPSMFQDVTSRFRIDSSMVYLYGYSAGNWAASGIISNNTDTSYNRFVTAIHSSSGATQDLVWPGVKKIGQRNIPFFVVTGDGSGSDLSYRDQATAEVDTINTAVPLPNPAPVHVIMAGQGHCCFDTRAANSTTYADIGGKNLIQWFFQFSNPYAHTWAPTGPPTAPATTSVIQVNVYGGVNPYNNAAWNNWDVSSALTSAALTHSDGSSSPVTATLDFSQAVQDNGSSYGGTICPPEVLRYTSYATSDRLLTINNLDPTASYDLQFFASKNYAGSDATIFTIGAISDTVSTDFNKTVAASFTAIKPDSTNKILIHIKRQNVFQYLNGFTIATHTTPFANAGSDVSIYMPKTSAQLNGTDLSGTATTIQWRKLSGGAHPQEDQISDPASLSPIVSNIGVGDHAFELYLSGPAGQSRDTVIVHAYPQKSRTPHPNHEKFTLMPTGGDIWYPNVMASFPTLNGGDTLVIGANAGVVQLYGDDGSGGWGGDSLNPIVVINPPGQQITISNQFRIDGQYIKVTGSGAAGIRYGFKLAGSPGAGFVLPTKHSNVEIERCYMLKGDNGIYAKNEIDSMNVLTYHPNWTFRNDWFHDNLFDSTGGESMYIGHTFFFDQGQPQTGYVPVKHDGLTIERDSVRWAGWDGIQTSNSLNVTIRHNYVYETGRARQSSQLFGIILGAFSTGRVDSNEVHLARSSGIAIFGFDNVKVRSNTIDSCGYADYQQNQVDSSIKPFTSIFIQDNQITGMAAPSPALSVLLDHNCIGRVSSYTIGAAIRSTNLNGTTLPGSITNNTIGDSRNRSLSNLIYDNTPGDNILGNTPGSCTPLSIQVNVYGGVNPYNNAAWNNWDVSSALTSAALTYSDGSSSPVTATLDFSQAVQDNGSSYGGTICPPEVLRYTSYATSDRLLTINNLDPTASYDLQFFASKNYAGSDATIFTIGAISDTVSTDFNKTVAASFTFIQPDSTNKIRIRIRRQNVFQYLNGFILTPHNGQRSVRSVGHNLNEAAAASGLVLVPNPVYDRLNIRYNGNYKGRLTVAIYDQTGRRLLLQTFDKNMEWFDQSLNTTLLGKGAYYLVVTQDDGRTMNGKFIKL